MPVQMAALAFVVRDAMTGIEFEAASNKHGETLLVGVWQGGRAAVAAVVQSLLRL